MIWAHPLPMTTTFCPSATTRPPEFGWTRVRLGALTYIHPSQLGGVRPGLGRTGEKFCPVVRSTARIRSKHWSCVGLVGPGGGGEPGRKPVPICCVGWLYSALRQDVINMTTWFDVVLTTQAPLGMIYPHGCQLRLISRGFPNGDSEAPGGPGGQAETGSI